MIHTFKTGDVVELKRGGFPMTVARLGHGVAHCFYFYGDEVVREWWPVACLQMCAELDK